MDNTNTKKTETTNFNNPSDWGYDLYPERKGSFKRSLTGILTGTEGNEAADRMRCEKTVYKCFKTGKRQSISEDLQLELCGDKFQISFSRQVSSTNGWGFKSVRMVR